MGPSEQYVVTFNNEAPFQVRAFDRDEALSKALRRRFGYRTALTGGPGKPWTVIRTGRHGRIRKTLVVLDSVAVDEAE